MDFVTLQARLRPGSIAVNDVTHQRTWTYTEFDTTINRLVSWCQVNGLKQGDRVACLSKNRAELVALRREARQLRMEREILKKAAAFFAKENQ